MKLIVCLFVLALCLSIVELGSEPRHYDLKKARQYFEKYIKDYHKVYKNSRDKEIHYKAFKRTLKSINEGNANNPLTIFGLNKFSDYTDAEIRNLYGLKTTTGKLKLKWTTFRSN